MTSVTSGENVGYFAGPNTGSAYASYTQAREERRRGFYQATRSVRGSLIREYEALGTRQMEERRALSMSADEITRRAAEASGAALASSGQGAVSGASVAALLSDIHRRRLEQETGLLLSQQFRERQRAYEAQGLQAQAMRELTAAAGGPVALNLVNTLLKDAEFWASIATGKSPFSSLGSPSSATPSMSM